MGWHGRPAQNNDFEEGCPITRCSAMILILRYCTNAHNTSSCWHVSSASGNGKRRTSGIPLLAARMASQKCRNNPHQCAADAEFCWRVVGIRNVWSAALSQAKNDCDRLVCANV